MDKLIKYSSTLNMKQNAPGFASVDMFHSEHGFEPFLVFTEFHMDRPIFGPHPHAGVSVMTYMLPDSKGAFLNRDSFGDNSIIEPGGIHVTQAGIGIQHDEVPTITGTDCHGFQIWINHSDQNRLAEPRAFHALVKEVPEFKNETALVRIIQGTFEGHSAPFELLTKTTLLDVTLQPESTISFPAKAMAFVYLIAGELIIASHKTTGKAMITFEQTGDSVTVKTGKNSANFMFATGTPHNEPIVHGGPFVMTTAEQMTETKRRFQRGEMGVLNPL